MYIENEILEKMNQKGKEKILLSECLSEFDKKQQLKILGSMKHFKQIKRNYYFNPIDKKTMTYIERIA